MRVIAGLYRSRILASPPGTTTRPTSDRLRETLFNIVSPRVPGSVFIDLFAGTGAVGIEAMSRGAVKTFFAENADPALRALRANLAALQITSSYTLEHRGVSQLLQKLASLNQPANIVFLDPPYEDENAYSQTLGFLGSLNGRKLLAHDAIVIAEHATRAKFKLPQRYGSLFQTRVYKQGDASLSFYAEPSPT